MANKITRSLIIVLILVLPFSNSSYGVKQTSRQAIKNQPLYNQKSKSIYPLNTNVTIKYWVQLHNNVAPIAKNLGDTEYAKQLEKNTGIKVQYIHPKTGQEIESFSIMVASGDMPDIIEYDWLKLPGGPNGYINNGIILKLNDIFKNYAPNINNFLKNNPSIDKMVKTDEGNYYAFPNLKPEESLLDTFGPIVRKDWLDDLGLSVPQTMDDWYNMLTKFKTKKNASAPLTAVVRKDDERNSNFSELIKIFASGTDSYQYFYIDNGKIKFGPIEPTRKTFFETMAKWYKEGLIDKNFAYTDNKTLDNNITSGKSGATAGSGGDGIGKWMTMMKEKDPKYNLVPAPYPTPERGQIPKFAVRSLEYFGTGSAAITSKCKNVEVAARLLDYLYGKEGHMFVNFGIQGISYNIENGYPKYTKLITENPNKLPMSIAMSQYTRGNTYGPFIQDSRYLEQYYALPQQKQALKIWGNNEQKKYRMLPITPTEIESQELANIMAPIDSYIDEMTLKFIMGVEPVDSFDNFTDKIKGMGIDKAISVYQNALDRYNKR